MQKTCSNCRQNFEISDVDLQFYKNISPMIGVTKKEIPPPTMCPDCRQQRRLAFRNERSLFHRKCDLTGKQIISMYPPDSPYTIYEIGVWHSDQWDPISFGQDIDFTKPFFDQFLMMRMRVPRMSLVREGTLENVEYCNRVSNSKNCYLIFSSNFNEDSYYSTRLEDSRSCMDCHTTYRSELCYECIDCQDCYHCFWAENSTNCHDCVFIKDCIGCSDCLFSTGLRNQKYCIRNQQYSKDDYDRERASLQLSKHQTVHALAKKFSDIRSRMIVKESIGTQNESTSGNYNSECKDSSQCYDCRQLEDCAYLQSVTDAKDCQDFCYWGRGCELIYETHACGLQCQKILFSNECWEGSSDLLYCENCIGSHHLFGCIGLRHKNYCILNKQYSKEEYEKIVSKLVEHMRKTEEWGSPFHITASTFAYDETVAQDYFPLTQQEVEKRGWRWRGPEREDKNYFGPAQTTPDDIADVSDDICNHILHCEATNRPYRIIPQELKFYRTMGIPLPKICPDERHRRRMALRNPRKLWKRACAKCGSAIETTYAPERTETVYCESCYQQAIY